MLQVRRVFFVALIAALCPHVVYADSIITFQQWRFTTAPANPGNIPADFPNPNGAFASSPGATHGDSILNRDGILVLAANDLLFTVPNTVVPQGSKVIDVQFIYQLLNGGTLADTRFNMTGFTRVTSSNFNTALPDGWFQADFQFIRNGGCPASETLTVSNPGNLMVDYAAIRTECTLPVVTPAPEPSSLLQLSLAGGLFVLCLGLRPK